MTWVLISRPRRREEGRSGERATRRPPKPQPMSAMVIGFERGVGELVVVWGEMKAG